jgi:hypothetical protein
MILQMACSPDWAVQLCLLHPHHFPWPCLSQLLSLVTCSACHIQTHCLSWLLAHYISTHCSTLLTGCLVTGPPHSGHLPWPCLSQLLAWLYSNTSQKASLFQHNTHENSHLMRFPVITMTGTSPTLHHEHYGISSSSSQDRWYTITHKHDMHIILLPWSREPGNAAHQKPHTAHLIPTGFQGFEGKNGTIYL